MKRTTVIKLSRALLVTLLAVCLVTAAVGIQPVAAAAATHKITFDVQGIGETPEPVIVNDGDKFLYLRENGANNPTAEGYVFNCWVTTLDFEHDEVSMANTAAYLETPIHGDITLYAVWDKVIDSVEITTDAPVPGDVIGTEKYQTDDFSRDYQWPRPSVEVVSEGAEVSADSWVEGAENALWLEYADDRGSTFKGTFINGRTYGVYVMLEPLFGYRFADSLTVTVNGETLPATQGADYNLAIITAPVLCGEAGGDTTPVSFAKVRGDDTRYYRGDTIYIPRGSDVYICFDIDPYNGLIPGWRSDLIREYGFDIDEDPTFFEGEPDADFAYAHISAEHSEAGDKGTLYYSWYRLEDIFGEEAVGWVDAIPVFSSSVDLEVTDDIAELWLGDADTDGEVTILDATCVQRYLAGLDINSFRMLTADADRDGEVTILDATEIQRYLAGLSCNDEIGEDVAYGTYYAVWNVNTELLPEGSALEGEDAELARAEIRRALSLLIDRRWIAEEGLPVKRIPASTFVSKWLPDADGSEFHYNAGRGEGKGYYDSASYGSNVEAAVEILKKYYNYDKDTGKFTNIPELTYIHNNGEVHANIANKIKNDFAEVGITLKVDSCEWPIYLGLLDEGNYSIARNGWVLDHETPMEFLRLWASDSPDNNSGIGMGDQTGKAIYSLDLRPYGIDYAVTDATWAQTYDKLLDAIDSCADKSTAYSMMHLAEDMLMSTGVVIPLYYY